MCTSTQLAKPLAPEDIETETYVVVLHTIEEILRGCCDDTLAPLEITRIAFTPYRAAEVFRVEAVCLPFVLVRNPSRQSQVIDIRRHHLAAVSSAFGRRVFKSMRPELA